MSIQVHVRFQESEIWFKFKEFVVQKHGKLHSALGQEVANALKAYLEAQSTHTHFSRKRSSKIQRELPKIKEAVLEKVEAGGSIPKQMLANIIRRVSGVSDKRAVGDRIDALIADGFLQADWMISPDGKVFKVMPNEAGKLG